MGVIKNKLNSYFNKIGKNIQNKATEEVESRTTTMLCPHCSNEITILIGTNSCPYCVDANDGKVSKVGLSVCPHCSQPIEFTENIQK